MDVRKNTTCVGVHKKVVGFVKEGEALPVAAGGSQPLPSDLMLLT